MAGEIVVGVFASRDEAQRAIADLVEQGVREDEIGYAVKHEAAPNDPSPAAVTDMTAADGPAGGAATGAITGGVLGGLIAAAAALIVPGVGPVLAGGLLASTVGGAAIGAAAGGLLGTLVGLGVPEEEAALLEQEIHAGRAVVTVRAGSRADRVRELMRGHGARV